MRFKHKTKLTCALALVLIISVILGLTACKKKNPAESAQESGKPVDPQESGIIIGPPDINGKPNGESSTPPTESPDITYVEGPDLSAREAVGDEFFEDAAFMGNSLMDGFRMFSGLTTCDYYAATSMSVIGATSVNCITLDSGAKGTMLQGLTQKPYGKIYILLGINEIGMNVDSFIESYGKMIDSILEVQTDCDVYIMGLTPVSYAKSSSSDTFTMAKIKKYNDALYALAKEKGCYYMDLVQALADDTGYLPSSETTDGVHFSAKMYTRWCDYVRTHYA